MGPVIGFDSNTKKMTCLTEVWMLVRTKVQKLIDYNISLRPKTSWHEIWVTESEGGDTWEISKSRLIDQVER